MISTPSLSCGKLEDTVFFELTDIDGEPYLDTHDLVDVNEDGSISYVGRTNKYFINDEGARFDAGIVETAVMDQPDIESCGLAPAYDKITHDTVPVLYVQTAGGIKNKERAVRNALNKVFIQDGRIKDSNLPFMQVSFYSLLSLITQNPDEQGVLSSMMSFFFF